MQEVALPSMGNLRVGDLDVAYMECVGRDGRPHHWFLAAGEDGVAHARPLRDGPLVPGRPEAAAAEIESRLSEILATPATCTANQVDLACRQGLRSRFDADPMMRTLRTLGVPAAAFREAPTRQAISRALAPVRDRLAARIAVVHAYESGLWRQSVSKAHVPSSVGVARAYRLTRAELAGLGSVGMSMLRELLELDGIELAASPEAILRDLLTALEVPAAAIRRLPPGFVPEPPCVAAMRAIPIDWVPSPEDGRGWRALEAVAMTLEATATPAEEWMDRIAGCKGDWDAFLRRCGAAANGKGTIWLAQYLPDRMRSALDVTRAFQSFLMSLGPDGREERRVADAVSEEATMGELNLPSILGNSRRWHRAFKALPSAGMSWEPILPAWTDPGTGIEVVPLRTSDALIEEGGLMDHCVGGETYARGCLRDQIRIVSLRRSGERLSTAEIELGPPSTGGMAPGGVAQHLGPSNAPPAPEAKAALGRYAALGEVREARYAAEPNGRSPPPRTDAEAEAILDAWRPYLTGRWKGASLSAFREAMAGAGRDPGMRPGPAPA